VTADGWTPLRPAATGQGGWYLYRFFTRQPCAIAGCTVRHPLYIGKSNDPLRRWLEHAPKQPWWSAQCGYEIDERVWPSDRAVRAAETQAIQAELPLANVDGNEHNPHRLDFGQAVPRLARTRTPRPARSAVAPARGRRDGLSRGRRHAVAVLFTWGVLSTLLWLVGLRLGLHGSAAASDAGVGAASLLLAAWGYTRPRRQRFWALLANASALAGGTYLLWATVLAPHWAAWTATTR
jgi:hypothetical protein